MGFLRAYHLFLGKLEARDQAPIWLQIACYSMREVLPIREGASGFVVELGGRGFGRPKHSHEELELNLVTRGEGVYLIEGSRVRITKHTLLTLHPEKEHLLIDTSSDFHMWILVMRCPLLRVGELLPESACVVLDSRSARLLAELCVELESGPLELLNSGLTFCVQLGKKLAAEAKPSQIGARVHPAVQAAARRLRQDPELALGELAKSVQLSEGRLGRLFKTQMGVALSRYRNRIRLESARQRLGEPQANVLQIALESGFGSYAQFYRVFREETGLSPAAARRELRAMAR
jgi:AraC-like DNA-binding protein